MNNKKIHIIHPKDVSTDFLEEIYKYVSQLPDVEIKIYRLSTQDHYFSVIQLIPILPNNELILFLGHGTSTTLSGSRISCHEMNIFIEKEQLKIFKEKNVVLLSCRSDQYLKKFFKDCNLKSAIGFPNLITDFEEVEHHDNPARLENITEEEIEAFRKHIVEVVKYSLEDYLNKDLTIFQFYNRIKLRINKRVINLYKGIPNKGKLHLGKMLNDMVDGLSFFGRY